MKKTTSIKKRTGERIRSLRLASGWSMRQLSLAAKVSERQLSNIELGKQAPRIDTVARIVGVFGVSLPKFFDDHPHPGS